MKLLCGVLIAILAAHVACSAKCFAESVLAHAQATASAEPPCHRHSGSPDHSQPSHQTANSCYPRSLLDGKITDGRLLLFASTTPAEAPAAAVSLEQVLDEPFAAHTPRGFSPPTSLPALRI